MAKKLISVWLSLTLLIFSTITIHAEEETIKGQFLNRTIDINGSRIENYYLENPIFLYQGAAYFPLTEEMGDLLGFTAEMDQESRTLKILKKEPVQGSLQEKTLKSNLINPTAKIVDNMNVIAVAERGKRRPSSPVTLRGVSVTAADINIGGQLNELRNAVDSILGITNLAEEQIDQETYPVLLANNVYYLPVRALTGESPFGWNVLYEDYSGLYVSTDGETPANAYFNQAESDYNRGLAQYILSRNPSIGLAKATMLVFLFRHEAEISNVDEILLMAMSQRESTFRSDAIGGTAIGLMQITVGTGERNGIARAELFDPHVNIEFGARYIGDKLIHFGDKTLALTAYNQGGAAISRGTYSTRYALRIIDSEQAILDFLNSRGYGLGSGN